MISRTNIVAFFLTVTISLTAMAATPSATETWNDAGNGTAGWVGNTTSSTVVHQEFGGNPGGYIESRRGGPFDIGALIDADDSATFTGDYGDVNQVSFDAAVVNGNVSDLWLRFRTGPSEHGWRFPFGGIKPADEEQAEGGGLLWLTYVVNLDPNWSDVDAMGAGWEPEDGAPAFATVLADVDTAEVRFAGTDTLLVGIDNFSIVPEPNSIALLSIGSLVLLGMSRRKPRR